MHFFYNYMQFFMPFYLLSFKSLHHLKWSKAQKSIINFTSRGYPKISYLESYTDMRDDEETVTAGKKRKLTTKGKEKDKPNSQKGINTLFTCTNLHIVSMVALQLQCFLTTSLFLHVQ